MQRNDDEEIKRWFDIQWSEHTGSQFQTSFEVIASNRIGLVYDITAVLMESRIPIVHSASRVLKNGDAIFEKLISKHENIVLVLSSHDPWQGLVCSQVQGDAGNTVTQIMVAPQGLDAHVGATGMVAMLYFSSDGNAIAVRYYSTVRGQYGSDTSHFVLDLTPDTEEG
jgi:hypothetical protein